MSAPSRREPDRGPPGYAELERAAKLFDVGEDSRWIANRLHGVPHPAARQAVHLLRIGERAKARVLIERTLAELAGPASGARLSWFRADHHAATHEGTGDDTEALGRRPSGR